MRTKLAAALAAVAVAAAVQAAPTESRRRGSLELGAGPYRPSIDGEFSGSAAPYDDVFGGGQQWGFHLVLSRAIFTQHGAVIEDPGTGSACATLGGWLLATGATLPQSLTLDQGEAVGRPCRLGLAVTADRRIHVSGRVIQVGRGVLSL